MHGQINIKFNVLYLFKDGTNHFIECFRDAKSSEAVECILCLFWIKTSVISYRIYHQYGEKEFVNSRLLLADITLLCNEGSVIPPDSL